MLKVELDNSDRNKTILGCSFFKKYLGALNSLSKTLEEEKPAFIIALSRKAPHILELMHLSGIWKKNSTVISEKAIDFIPPEEFKGKKIVIFDDIITSGTTIAELLLRLSERYDADFEIVCIAIDRETIALKRDNKGYFFELGNGKKIHVDYKVSLTREDRFTFSTEIVRSFSFLNKPYDMDYALFHDFVGNFEHFLSHLDIFKVFNLTTVSQSNNGFRRHTILGRSSSLDRNFLNDILSKLKTTPQICKVRTYYDRKTMKVTIVPMVVFTSKNDLTQMEIFATPYSVYNDLINHAKKFIDPKNSKMATYKLVWYIVSYLYGLFFYLTVSKENKQFLPISLPSQNLGLQDIVYLFGQSLSREIIRFLDLHYDETMEIITNFNKREFEGAEELPEEKSGSDIYSKFDEAREAIYRMIKQRIRNKIGKEDLFTNQMATIFESTYVLKEVPKQIELREIGAKPEEARRLRTGFSFYQIKEMLSKEGVIQTGSDRDTLRASLALDFLVDAGVIIPVIYSGKDGKFERTYRYGEDALCAKSYGYLIASVLRNLFDYAKKRHKKTIPKITLEKIGVMIQYEIQKSGTVDILENPIDPTDRTLKVAPEFNRHGKVLSIIDEEDDRSYLFGRWCQKEGIMTSKSGGLAYSNEFLESLKFPDDFIPTLISRDKIALFTNLATLLYLIDREVDKSKQSEFLIALTTCCDNESYVRALKKLLQLFLKSKHSFDIVLSRISSIEPGDPKIAYPHLNQTFSQLKKWPLSVAHSTRHKKILRGEMLSIIDEIERYFRNSELRFLYEQNLSPQIDTIKAIHCTPIEEPIRVFREKLESLGEFCVILSDILRNLLELYVETYSLSEERQQEKVSHKIQVATVTLKKLKEDYEKWNFQTSQRPGISFDGFSTNSLTKLNVSSDKLDGFQFNLADCNLLLKELVPQIKSAHDQIDTIYNVTYSPKRWEKDLRRLFKKESLETEWSKAPYVWTIWYDIKDFSGGTKPENRRTGRKLVSYINSKLPGIKRNLDDGFYDLEEDDEKYIYITNATNVLPYLHEIMKSATEYDMYMRIGICSTHDTREPYFIHKDGNRFKTSSNHVLVKRLGTYLKEKGEEGDNYHSLAVTKDAFRRLWEDVLPLELVSNWELMGTVKEIYCDLRGIENYVSFKIARLSRKRTKTLDEFV